MHFRCSWIYQLSEINFLKANAEITCSVSSRHCVVLFCDNLRLFPGCSSLVFRIYFDLPIGQKHVACVWLKCSCWILKLRWSIELMELVAWISWSRHVSRLQNSIRDPRYEIFIPVWGRCFPVLKEIYNLGRARHNNGETSSWIQFVNSGFSVLAFLLTSINDRMRIY